MGAFLRRGGAPGGRARRGRVALAAVGAVVALAAVAVDLFALTATHDPAQATGGAVSGRTARPVPTAVSALPAVATSLGSARRPAVAASALRQIILPDLLIVAPNGLTAGQI